MAGIYFHLRQKKRLLYEGLNEGINPLIIEGESEVTDKGESE